MSVELMVEVLKHAPATLNPTERLTLVAIAESCRTDTRTTYYRDGWDAAELARRVGVTAESLTKVFRSLAAKGYEVRVAHAVKNGKPVFAFKGKQTTFRLPRFAPQRVDESPVFTPGKEVKGWTSVRQSLDESPGNEAQSLDESPPLLLKELPSKNTSSLSPREDDDDTSPAVVPTSERENDDASQEQPEPPNPVHCALLEAGCPPENLDGVQDELTARHEPRSPAWWRTVAKNGDLPELVAEVLDALQPMNQPVTAAQAANTHPFTPKDDSPDDCQLCPFPAKNGRHRVGNQGGGYIAQVMTAGADQNRPPRQRPLSPADQRVADAAPLYRKYKAQENGTPK